MKSVTKYILFSIFGLFFFTSNVFASQIEYGRFVPDISSVDWYSGSTKYTLSGIDATIGGNVYTRYSYDPVAFTSNNSMTINMTSGAIPADADYFYIQGLASGVEATSAYVNGVGYCSFMSLPSTTDYVNSMTSFVLKCPYNHDNYLTTNIFFNSFGNMNNNAHAAVVNIMLWHYYSTEKSAESVESLIKQQIEEEQKINEKFDEFNNADISDDEKELPDNSSFEDYENVETELMDKVNQADLSILDIGIDYNSSKWTWDTLTSLIQSHSVVFGLFIAVLSIGIIKLALGR